MASDPALNDLEKVLIPIVRRAVEAGLRLAFDDLLAERRNQQRFLSLSDAEKTRGISRRQLQEFIRSGVLPGYSLGGAKILVNADELDAFIRSHRVTSADADLDAIAEEALRTMSSTVKASKVASGNGSGAIGDRKLRGGRGR